ncbi:hypothetical protein OV203_07240 [Nannocystis sp. ILAH1]|uniref:hypothetical protein n=1 Tax=unclassified Nannocystis TaxID=2627009 RepID=UPI00227188AE|nr:MULTISPECIES: hypothetical protein [unclassified Nannocystis]MCY0986909.1 hypothetical protein [Nannocystis sp. ILAH1]MCY1071792.1 hypothetical protein [Nannocystis sp. RBIL2]
MTIRKNWLEWTVFAVGLALVLGIVGYLVILAVRHDDRPPRLGIHVGAATRTEDVEPPHYVVPVTVTNHGDRTVGDVHVEVTLVRDGAPVERTELTLPEVPRRSSRAGASTLQTEPATGQLRARVLGYSEP